VKEQTFGGKLNEPKLPMSTQKLNPRNIIGGQSLEKEDSLVSINGRAFDMRAASEVRSKTNLSEIKIYPNGSKQDLLEKDIETE